MRVFVIAVIMMAMAVTSHTGEVQDFTCEDVYDMYYWSMRNRLESDMSLKDMMEKVKENKVDGISAKQNKQLVKIIIETYAYPLDNYKPETYILKGKVMKSTGPIMNLSKQFANEGMAKCLLEIISKEN